MTSNSSDSGNIDRPLGIAPRAKWQTSSSSSRARSSTSQGSTTRPPQPNNPAQQPGRQDRQDTSKGHNGGVLQRLVRPLHCPLLRETTPATKYDPAEPNPRSTVPLRGLPGRRRLLQRQDGARHEIRFAAVGELNHQPARP